MKHYSSVQEILVFSSKTHFTCIIALCILPRIQLLIIIKNFLFRYPPLRNAEIRNSEANFQKIKTLQAPPILHNIMCQTSTIRVLEPLVEFLSHAMPHLEHTAIMSPSLTALDLCIFCIQSGTSIKADISKAGISRCHKK